VRYLFCLTLLMLGFLTVSCSKNSYVVVYVDADVNAVDPPLVMTSVRVTVTNNDNPKEVYFPASSSASNGSELTFPATFALTISPNHSGLLLIDIEGLDDQSQVIAHGASTCTIKSGERTNVHANLDPGGFACGDGNLDDGESCDDGTNNGIDGYCDGACRLVSGGTPPSKDGGADGGRSDARSGVDGGTSLDAFSDTAVIGSITPLSGASFVSAAAGLLFTCGVRHDGSMFCWGDNSEKQLGTNSTQASIPSPTQLAGSRWQAVTAGQYHACALDSSNLLTCWGRADSGQLGKILSSGKPVANGEIVQLADSDWATVAAGAYHTCAKKQDNSLWCWGQNFSGQLGLGVSAPQEEDTPTKVGDDMTWAMLTVGSSHVCATKTDTTVWCWGSNSDGQIGSGSSATMFVPAQIGSAGVVWVAAGASHTCATYSDGSLACWGGNDAGQLGDGTTAKKNVPTPVTGNGWALVSAGGSHTCAIKTDGTLWCWGSNTSGQLGDGSSVGHIQPTQVKSVTGTWSALSLGNSHTCGLLSTGSLYCWGDNSKGQIGVGTLAVQNKPILVGSQ
jgi:alpha-tubulin suppressor-like RCC1 family protein